MRVALLFSHDSIPFHSFSEQFWCVRSGSWKEGSGNTWLLGSGKLTSSSLTKQDKRCYPTGQELGAALVVSAAGRSRIHGHCRLFQEHQTQRHGTS